MTEPRIDTRTGLVAGAMQVPSPNHDARPDGVGISLLVLHGISLPPGSFGGPWIDDLFTNRLNPAAHAYFREIHTLRVSSHLLLRRDGTLVQYVPLYRRAWHAGESCWEGLGRCNDYSIGVELEGEDTVPYDERQYAALTRLVPALLAVYPAILPSRIVGHSDIAPGRKTDPGPAFDWQRLRSCVAERSSERP
ncbi:MAG: 1,6-anhydro-N-acetylmuramyl-L-alanine amidase AmpD [Aquisalimonadaceae bacterium]